MKVSEGEVKKEGKMIMERKEKKRAVIHVVDRAYSYCLLYIMIGL